MHYERQGTDQELMQMHYEQVNCVNGIFIMPLGHGDKKGDDTARIMHDYIIPAPPAHLGLKIPWPEIQLL